MYTNRDMINIYLSKGGVKRGIHYRKKFEYTKHPLCLRTAKDNDISICICTNDIRDIKRLLQHFSNRTLFKPNFFFPPR